MDRKKLTHSEVSPAQNIFEKGRNRVIGAGLITGLSIAALIGCAPTSAEPGSGPEVAPVTEIEWSPEITVEDVEIQAGLETQDLGKAIIDRLDTWINAGTDNEQIADDSLGTNTEVFAASIASQYRTIYSEGLFVADMANNAELKNVADVHEELNANVLMDNLATTNPELDKESFHRSMDFVIAREVDDGDNDPSTRTLEIDFIESNNAANNRVGEAFDIGAGTFGTPKGTFTVDLKVEDDTEKISGLTATNR
jgi:hypothetical protein